MIKLVCTDIDGTIFKPDYTFSESLRNCIKELVKNGVKVVLVTGRMHSVAQCIADDLGLDTPVVSFQGGMIVQNGNIMYEKNLPSQVVGEIINWAKERNAQLNFYREGIMYVEDENSAVKRYSKDPYTKYVITPFNTLPHTRVNKLLALNFEDAELVSSWRDELVQKYPDLYIVKSTPYYCEVSNKEASKYCAVKFLQELWGISEAETLCIGDQDNDIKLIEAGGIRVAMGNASEGLKSVADFITDDIHNDGFVKAMEKFVLGVNDDV